MRVLAEISFHELFRGDVHTLRVYTRWMYTRSERDARWLLRHGIIPYMPAPQAALRPAGGVLLYRGPEVATQVLASLRAQTELQVSGAAGIKRCGPSRRRVSAYFHSGR